MIDLPDVEEASRCSDTRVTLRVACGLLMLASIFFPAPSSRAQATPIFAQAYGLKCSACHLQVPILNAFGRYVQRTGYGALNDQALKHTFPVFLFDPGTSYSVQSGQPSHAYKISDPLQTTILYAAGALGPNIRYHAEQGVTLAGQPGWLLEAWVSYSDLLGGKGHVIVGKIPR